MDTKTGVPVQAKFFPAKIPKAGPGKRFGAAAALKRMSLISDGVTGQLRMSLRFGALDPDKPFRHKQSRHNALFAPRFKFVIVAHRAGARHPVRFLAR